MSTDRIEKSILLKASRSRVWRALADHQEFGSWFGVKLEAPFAPGQMMCGQFVGTTVDAEIAAVQRQFSHLRFELVIDRIEPERLFSFRWHPFAIQAGVDYSAEPMTLVVFDLRDENGGTRLTLTESGFDSLPIERRAKAFSANEGGWGKQMELIERYVEQSS